MALKKMRSKDVEKQDQPYEDTSLSYKAYWESSLFSSVYLSNDLKRDFSEQWGLGYDDVCFDENGDTISSGFYYFYNELRRIAPQIRSFSKSKPSESDTIYDVIAPVLDCLGWYDRCNKGEKPFATETSFTIKENGKSKVYRTDVILVDHPEHANFIKDSNKPKEVIKEARNYQIALLEAKYWNRILEEERSGAAEDVEKVLEKEDDVSLSLTFNEQTLKYMDILHSDWGILTDGNTWRLLNKRVSGEAPKRCFQFNLESLVFQEKNILESKRDEDEFLENAKYFYHFFSKKSFVKNQYGEVFLDEVLKRSRKYIDEIEEDLKGRFISAMNLMCNGLLHSAADNGLIVGLPSEEDLSLIRSVAESHLFNILFIKSCESKGVLPIKSDEYYRISLTSIIDRIEGYRPEKITSEKKKNYFQEELQRSLRIHKYKPGGHALYGNLINLTKIISKGASKKDYGFEVSGFRESIFTSEEWSFATKHKIDDDTLVKVLFELGYSKAAGLQRDYQQVPYNYFTARQLGSIYESFLEYKLEVAKSSMVYLQKGAVKQWVKLTAKKENRLKGFEPIARKGQLFFTPNNEDRKATGSYYTPDYVVKFIVKNTLEKGLLGCSSEDIRSLKVCDPAMGSGHFLIATLNFLTEIYLQKLESEVPKDELLTTVDAKREILSNSIFGVDLNPSAVKLAKLSLWLESAQPGKKLKDLNSQILVGDSLECNTKKHIKNFSWSESVFKKSGIDGFDCIVANPPYQNHKLVSNETRAKLSTLYPEIYKVKADLSNYFLYKFSELLSPGGTLGVITSRYFIDGAQSKDLRMALDRDYAFSQIINFENFQVFEANTLTLCMLGKKRQVEGDCEVKVKQFPDSLVGKRLERWPDDFLKTFEVSQQEIFTNGASSLREGGNSEVSTKKHLADVAYMGRGVSTGNDKVFVLSKSEAKSSGIEKEYMVDILKNGDIRAYHHYDSEIKKMIYTKKEQRLKSSSKAYNYLSRSRSDLEKRAEFKKEKIDWYEYSLYRCREKFDSKIPKIIFPYMATDNRFSYDEIGLFFCSDVGMVVLDEEYCSPKAMVCILNSKCYNEIHKQIGKLKRGGYYEYVSGGLKKYPVPESIEKRSQKRLDKLYDEIMKAISDAKKSLGCSKQEFDKYDSEYLKFPNYLTCKIDTLNNGDLKKIVLLKREIDSVVQSVFDDNVMMEAS